MTMTDQHEADPPPTPEAAVADRPDVEVVDPSVFAERTAGELATRQRGTLELATEAALNNPAVPGRDEFLMLATTARILSMSAGAPAAIRNNPWLAFHLALIGRDLGISPSAALQQIDVIGYDPRNPDDYDKVQLALSPELLNGQIKRLGLGRIVPGDRADTFCEAVALAPDGEVLGSYTFTWEEAVQAGLADERCQPFAHWVKPNVPAGDAWKNENKCRCRTGYRTYPKRMLWWRAAGYAAADYFPEASIGLYSPEELGAVVDADGRPIDPGSVEVPEGYGPPPPPPPPPPDPKDDVIVHAVTEAPDEDAGEYIDAGLVALRDDVGARLAAVKESGPEAVAALRALWEELDGDGLRKTPPWLHADFRRRHLTRARAVVQSIEDRIKRGEWGDDVKAAWADASVTGAGFGKGNGQAGKVTSADFGSGGKTPHQLARERAARERGTTFPPGGTQDTPTGVDSDAGDVDAPTPPDASGGVCEDCGVPDGQEHEPRMHELADAARNARGDGREQEPAAPAAIDPDDEARADCIGCGKPMKRKADGANHPGPNGRAGAPHRSFHRACAPFD